MRHGTNTHLLFSKYVLRLPRDSLPNHDAGRGEEPVCMCVPDEQLYRFVLCWVIAVGTAGNAALPTRVERKALEGLCRQSKIWDLA